MALRNLLKLFSKGETGHPVLLTNTLTRKKEEFKPLRRGEVRMYNCGPTVYDYAHIGNMRAYVTADIIRRTFEVLGFSVKQVVNITDIGHLSSDADEGEDKMTKALLREGKPLTLSAMREVADFYYKAFRDDLEKLNILPAYKYPFASDHISEDIELVQNLEKKGFTYKTADGIYFDTSKDPHYGKLGGITDDEGESRISVNREKKSVRDFALWKFNSELGYDAPFGKGFPGWHIECSAMAMKYLGESFDIHTGGIEHIPVHHNNEIAQSENATGKPFANYWLHHNHMTVDGRKMAKSEGTGFTLTDLTEKNIHPLAYRYWLLTAHYSTPANFTWEALSGAQTALEKIVHGIAMSERVKQKENPQLRKYLSDDFDTPKAIALLNTLANQGELAPFVDDFDRALGLNLKVLAEKVSSLTGDIQKLLSERNIARDRKDWQKSDELRDQIQESGFIIYDKQNKTFALRTLQSLI